MICQCGATVTGVSVVRGVVRVSTCKCSCGRVHKKVELTVDCSLDRIQEEIRKIKESHPCYCSPHICSVLNFLRVKEALLESSSLSGKQSALWERAFLKRTIGDDY